MESVQNLFNFIIGCYDANEMIKNYISSGEYDKPKEIDLMEVLDFMSSLKTSSESNCDIDHIKVEKEEWNFDDLVEEIKASQESTTKETIVNEVDNNVKRER